MLKEFKEFALRGNVVDLAIGVIIGSAFGKIVDSMVADVIMPIVGSLTGGLDFSNKFILLKALTGDVAVPATYAKAKEVGATVGYGQFLTITINFLIIAFVLFLVVKGNEPPEAPGRRRPRRRSRRRPRPKCCSRKSAISSRPNEAPPASGPSTRRRDRSSTAAIDPLHACHLARSSEAPDPDRRHRVDSTGRRTHVLRQEFRRTRDSLRLSAEHLGPSRAGRPAAVHNAAFVALRPKDPALEVQHGFI